MNHGPFIFERYEFRKETGVLHLQYRFENGPAFEEQIAFPTGMRELSPNDLSALDTIFRLIFLLAGASYYKAYAPEQMECPAFSLDDATAKFVEKVYRKGLAEFAYKNKLDLSNRARFAESSAAPPRAISLELPRHSLVPVGGGKDSIVTLECLKQSGEPVTLYAQGRSATGIAAPIEATIAESGLPAIRVARTLSPNLAEINKSGAYNGHVPITAILSSITVACAILYGFDAVILSNEHSASAPNLKIGDNEINHQYSKSFEFEKDFASYVKNYISPSISYFSLLRPLSETEIVRRFAKQEKYHAIFRSCNRGFRQDAGKHFKDWCCDCPKCRFVFLALAPFVTKEHLTGIFGKNLLADKAQENGFAELCGVAAHKPFECVGEIFESALLMEKLYRSGDWKDDIVVHELGARLAREPHDFEKLYKTLFAMHSDHNMPERYMRMLDARR